MYVAEAVPSAESVTVYVTEGAVPVKSSSGVNVITPVELTTNEPTPSMVTVLPSEETVQSGLATVHESTTDAGSNSIAGSAVVSPSSKSIPCGIPFGPVVVSRSAVGSAGSNTVGVYVVIPD